MIRPKLFVYSLAAMAFLAQASHASIILSANITNSQETNNPVLTTSTGAPRPASFGTAQFVINDAMTAMTFTATILNIDFTGSQTADTNDNLIAAHIHAAPTVTPATSGPVVWGFFGAPFNDNSPNDVVITPSTTGVGGTISGKWDLNEGNNTTLSAQLSNILSGHSYINFHTTQFPGGESRGNILVQVTPEPSSSLLFLSGVGGLLALVLRRRIK
jgi:hypothetical protein